MKLFYFFYDNFPPFQLVTWLFPVSLLYALLALYISGILKLRLNWRTGITRKVFHFLIFFLVFIIQHSYYLQGTFIVGWAVTAVLIFSVSKGGGSLFYEGIAREQDAPHRSKYIAYSYLATFIGGVLTNFFFGRFYGMFGYLVTGITDALAEPVGVLFGRHRYRVINFNKKTAYRSWEGSAAVFISSWILLLLSSYYFPAFIQMNFPVITGCAILITLVEAISPQGWDNMLLQLAGGYAVYCLLGV